jgi:hypothetical protein
MEGHDFFSAKNVLSNHVTRSSASKWSIMVGRLRESIAESFYASIALLQFRFTLLTSSTLLDLPQLT